MSVSFGLLCAAATATGGNVAPFNREGREAARKSLCPQGGRKKVEVGVFPPNGQRGVQSYRGKKEVHSLPGGSSFGKKGSCQDCERSERKTEYLMDADF